MEKGTDYLIRKWQKKKRRGKLSSSMGGGQVISGHVLKAASACIIFASCCMNNLTLPLICSTRLCLYHYLLGLDLSPNLWRHWLMVTMRRCADDDIIISYLNYVVLL